MSYERTTPKDLVEAINMPQGEDMTRFLLYAQRLWEIENAIERGEIVKLPRKEAVTNSLGGRVFRVVYLGEDGNVHFEYCDTEQEADNFIKQGQK